MICGECKDWTRDGDARYGYCAYDKCPRTKFEWTECDKSGAKVKAEPVKVVSIDTLKPHKVSEVICVRCGRRWIAVRPEKVLLKELECPDCGAGYVIETGQQILEDMEE